MTRKPHRPCPSALCQLLRRVLPHPYYRRWIGRHEDESTRLWQGLAISLPRGRAILDIGAFHGEFALAARKVNATATIYAFEPNPYSATLLREVLASREVEVVEKAVSDRCGTVRFCCAAAQSRIEPANENPSSETHEVTSVTLDLWVESNGVEPALIKIDVECAETAVLQGGRKLIERCRPAILCEVLTDAAGESVMSVLPARYHFWHIDENYGVTRQDQITRRKWRNKNWLLLPQGQEPPQLARA